MKITIVVPDNVVVVDGVARTVNLSSLGNIHAVQWDGKNGHIEFNDLSNQAITDVKQFQAIINEWVANAPQPVKSLSLAEAKAAKSLEIDNARDEDEASGFTFLGNVYDSDQISVLRIIVSVQAAQASIAINAPFAIDWTTQDNKVVTLDAVTLVQMPLALATNAYLIHQKARDLQVQITNCTTVQQVNLIVWN